VSRIVKVKNDTLSDEVWRGTLIASGTYYQLHELEFLKWKTDNHVYGSVASGTLLVNDGVVDFTDPVDGWDWLVGDNVEAIVVSGVLTCTGTINLVGADGANISAVGDTITIHGNPPVIALGDLAAVQARRTTAYTLTATYADMTFDQTDIETDDNVLAHNDGNTERIEIKADGLYFISYAFNGDPTSLAEGQPARVNAHVKKNGSTVLDGSHVQETMVHDVSLDGVPYIYNHVSNSFLVQLATADYVTVQLRYFDYVGDIADGHFKVVKLDGVKGVREDGFNIYLEENLSTVSGTPHHTVNFGAGLLVTDDGNGRATVDSHHEIQYNSSEAESSTTSSTWQQKVRLSTGVVPAGIYRVGWYMEGRSDDTGAFSQYRVQVDDSTDLMEWDPVYAAPNIDKRTNGGHHFVTLTSGSHNFDIDYRNTDGKTTYIGRARIETWRRLS